MADAGVRVALLARAGKARDQLHRALGDAGALIVAEGDPSELDPGQVAAQAPSVYLVSLEPAIETALDRFDELLAADGVEVMFDDAEVTARLDGWDLNRWARHLTSKLLGSEGLPPVPGDATNWDRADVSLDPGAPPTPAELMDDARLEDYTAETSEMADSIPISSSWSADPGESDSGLDLEEIDFTRQATGSTGPDPEAEADIEPMYGELDMLDSVDFSAFGGQDEEADGGDLDADVAELAAHLEAFEKNDQRFAVIEPDFAAQLAARPSSVETTDVPGAADVEDATAVAPARASVNFDFSNLALAPMEGEPEALADIAPAFSARSGAPEMQLAALEDASPAPSEDVAGAVLILAGLGGPDAVRQLLSSLPEKLKVPVLLYQHLEVGKHARLVEQLAKISRLPVVLAQDGAVPEPGKVTLLPAGLTAKANGSSLSFTPGTMSQLIAALPPRDSVIIVLSGTDEQLVPMILSVQDAGGLVLAQDPEVCFDASAAEAMRRQGAAVYPALGLARQIAARWLL
ncbi:MAG: hypothetical protein KAY03_02550 [Arenimonas sp.]|nr:hypothetical protein [Arenimonas sp.]